MGKNTQDFLVTSSMHQSSILSYSIIVCFVVRDVDVKLFYYLYLEILPALDLTKSVHAKISIGTRFVQPPPPPTLFKKFLIHHFCGTFSL